MELRKQLVSIEMAKKLVKLGVKQESFFVYVLDGILGTQILPRDVQGEDFDFPAYSSSELGELLPTWIKNPTRSMIEIWSYNNGTEKKWAVAYRDDYEVGNYGFTIEPKWGATMADAMAKMLAHLIAKKIIT